MVSSTVQEELSRDAMLALANNYSSMTDALMELIDNPFDYRRGNPINIRVDVGKAKGGSVTITDWGGLGMDIESIRDWIKWGTGHQHVEGDIGQFHVGGKLAAVYLAESVEILSRKAGETQVYKFYDPHWGSRRTTYTGKVELVDSSTVGWEVPMLAQLPESTGFTMFKLGKRKHNRYDKPVLMNRLGNVYRNLILNHQCTMFVDGDEVLPLAIPESPTDRARAIEVKRVKVAPGVFVQGRFWVMDRDKVGAAKGATIRAGVRTLFHGRLITDGETFGHNLAGRGTLQRLVGEVQIDGIKPTTAKENWQRGTDGWHKLEEFLHQQMHPLFTHLNQVGESRVVDRDQTKRTARVLRELSRVFDALNRAGTGIDGSTGGFDAPAGRIPPAPGIQSEKKDIPAARGKGEIVNITEPPTDRVGKLLRRFQGDMPEVTYRELGQAAKTVWLDGDEKSTIVINTDYPSFLKGNNPHIAETVIFHIVSSDDEFKSAPAERVINEVNRVMWAWHLESQATEAD